MLEPKIAECVLGEIVGERLGQADAVDPTRGGTRDDVDDDPRAYVVLTVCQLLQQPRVDALAGRPHLLGVGRRLQQCRPANESVNLLRHSVHVHGERRAAITDHSEPELLRPPLAPACHAGLHSWGFPPYTTTLASRRGAR